MAEQNDGGRISAESAEEKNDPLPNSVHCSSTNSSDEHQISKTRNGEDVEQDELRRLLVPDIRDLPITPPSSVETNFVTYFALDLIKPGHDQYVHRHANGINAGTMWRRDTRDIHVEPNLKVRESLIRQEDTIVYSLIERANFPMNFPAYDSSRAGIPGFSASIVEYVFKETEAIQSKAGRYESPEEHPFFPDNLPTSIIMPPPTYPQILHPAAASININKRIWDFYFNELLPLFIVDGDDGNYVCTVTSDLNCLQALSRRIHYGKFVAEVKFSGAPEDYGPAIRVQDGEALMKLLTFESVEEMVKKRVEKKAMIFGQEVCLEGKKVDEEKKIKYKIDPSILSLLYDKWVMPLTKDVEVKYLLRRLD